MIDAIGVDIKVGDGVVSSARGHKGRRELTIGQIVKITDKGCRIQPDASPTAMYDFFSYSEQVAKL